MRQASWGRKKFPASARLRVWVHAYTDWSKTRRSEKTQTEQQQHKQYQSESRNALILVIWVFSAMLVTLRGGYAQGIYIPGIYIYHSTRKITHPVGCIAEPKLSNTSSRTQQKWWRCEDLIKIIPNVSLGGFTVPAIEKKMFDNSHEGVCQLARYTAPFRRNSHEYSASGLEDWTSILPVP